MLALLCSAAFAGWTWLRPYSWNPDPAARCRIQGCEVRQDQSFFWLHVHLRMLRGESHDLLKPVRLVVHDGREVEPADTTLGGTEATGTTDLWFKFWLESEEIEKPMTLKINDGSLVVRSNHGPPRLGSSGREYFTSNHW